VYSNLSSAGKRAAPAEGTRIRRWELRRTRLVAMGNPGYIYTSSGPVRSGPVP
jgi:hypothetical protein